MANTDRGGRVDQPRAAASRTDQGSTAGGTAAVRPQSPPEVSGPTVMDELGTLGQDVGESVEGASTAVGGVVQGASTAVSDTVATVKTAMSETVDSVRGAFASLRHAFDLRHQVRHHPWLMLGGAALLGFVMGNWLHRSGRMSG